MGNLQTTPRNFLVIAVVATILESLVNSKRPLAIAAARLVTLPQYVDPKRRSLEVYKRLHLSHQAKPPLRGRLIIFAEQEDLLESDSMHNIHSASSTLSPIRVSMDVNQKPLGFEVDTGAAVSVFLQKQRIKTYTGEAILSLVRFRI